VKGTGKGPGANVAAGTTCSSATSAPTPASAAPKPAAAGACAFDPNAGLVIPDSSRATQIRIAVAGSKALITFWETKKGREEGPDVETAFGHLYDASSALLGPRTKFEENNLGDEPVSAAAPVVVGGALFAISGAWAAPAGQYTCSRAKPGDRPTSLFAFSGISSGGPEKPDIAAVVKGDDALVVVPVGADLHLFSARV